MTPDQYDRIRRANRAPIDADGDAVPEGYWDDLAEAMKKAPVLPELRDFEDPSVIDTDAEPLGMRQPAPHIDQPRYVRNDGNRLVSSIVWALSAVCGVLALVAVFA